jgi:hypothetical protein
MRIQRHRLKLFVTLLAPLAGAHAQTTPDLQQILQRLDRLEGENRELRDQVRQLRDQLQARLGVPAQPPAQAPATPSTPTLEERMEIEERRTAELEQTKVEASQRFPIRITGMALANTFYNSKQNGGVDDPTVASVNPGPAVGGATWRQSIIGLEFHGPRTFWDGEIHGSLFTDFFTGGSVSLNNMLRLRTASIGIDWKTRSLTFLQDKPLISPYNPDSLAQVGVPPLAGAGNLWWWEPQVRFEQRFDLSDQFGLRAQICAIETDENQAAVPAFYAASLARARPGLEGRFEFFRNLADERRIAIASGFHLSETHVAGGSVPSHVFSTDWLIRPIRPIEFTGLFFTGENVANLATTGIRQGFSILGPGQIQPVHSLGGWAQLTFFATSRLSFHFMAGSQNDRASDLVAGLGAQGPNGGIGRNLSYGGNFFYKLAPNVIASFETMQTRTSYLLFGQRLNNHYDLALAYLF